MASPLNSLELPLMALLKLVFLERQRANSFFFFEMQRPSTEKPKALVGKCD